MVISPRLALEQFLEMMSSERGASSQTLSAYKGDLLTWFAFLGDTPLEQVTLEHRTAYLKTLQHLNARTLNRRLSALRQFHCFLLQEGILQMDPWEGTRSVRMLTKLPRSPSIEEVTHLLRSASEDDSPTGRRLWALLELLYATGMRISEAITLPLLSLPQGDAFSFLIFGKGGHERFVFLTPQAIEALIAYLKIRSHFCQPSAPPSARENPYLFPSRGKHLTRQGVGQALKNLALTSGLNPEFFSPHGLRHAFATHLMSRGVDLITLKQLLGHRDISTTQIYTHVETQRWSELLATHHPLGEKELPLLKNND